MNNNQMKGIKSDSHIKVFLTLTLIIFSLFLGFIKAEAQQMDPKKTLQKFAATLQIIDYFYVDSTDSPELVEDAIVEMLKKLDPHSVYIPAEDVQKANEKLVGNFEGVGIQFQIYKDTIRVIAPIPGGPSERLGILAGDKIIKIDDVEAFGKKIDNQFVFDHLRGPKGSKVKVSVKRNHKAGLIDFDIIRDEIPINSIDASFVDDNGIAYIKLNRFSATTMDEFSDAMKDLKEKGFDKLILDLRYNSGGYLNTAIDLADEFLDEGKLIVYTEGLKSPRVHFKATSKGVFEKGKLVVLINEGSASASEIVSGAVQDWDRGLILGRRSFGKGLVQKPFRLPDESMLRLTTARYYTPTGRCIQKSYENGVDDYYKDFQNRFEHGELINPDSINFPDSLKYYTPADRVVYGGGGIMPDIFIPFDSTRYSDYYVDLRRNSLFNSYVLDYVENERKLLLKEYEDFDDFNAGFYIDDGFLESFVSYAEEKDVIKDEEGLKQSENDIKYVLKALIARNLYDINAYFKVISEVDDAYVRAVEALMNEELFEKLKLSEK